jgi:valyl-tRNA synthetase
MTAKYAGGCAHVHVTTNAEPIDNHGSDGVRYWAAAARLGTDAAFDEGQMKVGRRLAVKILNAAKFKNPDELVKLIPGMMAEDVRYTKFTDKKM